MKSSFSENFSTFCTLTRAYSLPISISSWVIPFLFAALNGGNSAFGFLSLAGIIILHLASNLFDDVIDYSRELSGRRRGIKSSFNFQKGKCRCITDGIITLKQAFIIDFILFSAALAIGIFFFYIYGAKLLCIIIPAAVLCLLYPILGKLGLGEIIIAVIFSPLLYSGVYLVMTGSFSFKIMILAVSTGLLTAGVLVNHSILDFKYDTSGRKTTLCSLAGSEEKSLIILSLIEAGAYINLLFRVFEGSIGAFYLLPLLTLPYFIKMIKNMRAYIKKGAPPQSAEQFLELFLPAQNLQKYFTAALCISIIISYWFKI